MRNFRKYISYTAGVLMLLFTASCTEDVLWDNLDQPQGVDLSKMVEVTIPFQLSQAIQSNIVTRSTTDTDSQLSGVMVFVYENTGDPEKDQRVAWHLFSNPENGDLEHSTGGWIPDNNDPKCGKIKFHVPAGDCYIYLLGNVQGSFLDFFPEAIGPDDLATLQGFWNLGRPKWTGNMNTVDGYLPMVGMVNNERGNCRVKEDGRIIYTGFDNQEHTILPGGESEADDQSFILKRLMAKVTVNIQGSPQDGVTFIPKEYRFCNIPTLVSPIEAAWTQEEKDQIPLTDTKEVPFSAQSPNSFTVYLPEHVYTAQEPLKSFADRDKVVKTTDGKNVMTPEGKYQFQNAPQRSAYLEINGSFEKTEKGQITQSADCRYLIHLGDFGKEKGFQDFSVKRDYHYTYNITVKGVNDIVVEVTQEEKNPAVEGIVFDKGARLQLDAHFEQVEMKLKQADLKDGIYIYAKTPFGLVNCKYLPKEGGGTLDSHHPNLPSTKEEALKLLQWIEFKPQTAKGELATYQTGKNLDVFRALDQAVNPSSSNEYYTCFVDEYYYHQHPIQPQTPIGLSDFINAEDRIFSLGSDIKYSADGQSAVASAVYVLHQHAISCFYDLYNTSVAKYGVEMTDEIGEITPLEYGRPAREGTDAKNGRSNTLTETANHTSTSINWAKNGFLLNADDTQLVPSKERLHTRSAYLACLTRNRDFNGDGKITGEELRWYTPARDQMLGLWIGEPALPAKAALYPYPTDQLTHLNDVSNYPIYTSTNGNNRVIWGEEGCSFGAEGSAGKGGYVRAVRNLGAIPTADSYMTEAQPYYKYDTSQRTIEVYLTGNALRAYTSRELAPHHERSVVNRPYRKFQVAAQPYTEQATATCEGHGIFSPASKTYQQLQHTSAKEAKEDIPTRAAQYKGNGEADISTASWRLPNQRELALMIVAMGNKIDYEMDNGEFHHIDYGCKKGWFGHDWRYKDNYILHCRTSFSNTQYTSYGYMYNTNTQDGKKIQMLWTKKVGDNNQDLGQGPDGQGGYLCVRDVQQP